MGNHRKRSTQKGKKKKKKVENFRSECLGWRSPRRRRRRFKLQTSYLVIGHLRSAFVAASARNRLTSLLTTPRRSSAFNARSKTLRRKSVARRVPSTLPLRTSSERRLPSSHHRPL